jgi:DNA-binding transcriptional MerR regulator
MTPLDRHRQQEHMLTALTEAAREVLAHAPAPPDGRVARYPDERTIRYYQSLGLIDRPLRYEGKEAMYGYQHLLRVVAVKLLQHQGLSLAQVQAALIGVSVRKLEAAVTEALAAAPQAAKRVAAPPARAAAMRAAAVDEGTVPGARAVVQADLSPGIRVTIDPALVPDAERILRVLRHALKSLE